MRLEELKTQGKSMDSVLKIRKVQDLVIQQQRDSIAKKQREITQREQAAAKATAAAVKDLRAELTSEQQVKLDAVTTGYEQQLVLKDRQIEQAQALTRLAEAQVAGRDSVIDQLRKFDDDLLKQLNAETKRNKPSLASKAIMASGWIAALLIAVK